MKVLLSDFISRKKFDDYIKVLSFYHVEKCEHDDCSQCLFTINLRYVYTEHVTHEKKMLRNFVIIVLRVKNNLLLQDCLSIDLLN